LGNPVVLASVPPPQKKKKGKEEGRRKRKEKRSERKKGGAKRENPVTSLLRGATVTVVYFGPAFLEKPNIFSLKKETKSFPLKKK